MADDLGAIELSLVVREKGLKESLTLTQRLEREITRATKALDANKMSQDRYNKVLLQAKREYQTLGVSSQKATSEVRKFAAAQQQLATEAKKTTEAIGRQTKAIDTFSNTSRKGMRRMEVIAQQAGFQIGDLAVQIQGGTNAAVAFGQQASQLLGFFGPAGAIAGAGIAIATGLIAPFMRGEKAAKDLTDRIKDLNKEIADIKGTQVMPQEQIDLLAEQEKLTMEIIRLQDDLVKKQSVVSDLENKRLTNNQLFIEAQAQVLATQDQIAQKEEERASNSEILLSYQNKLLEKRQALANVEERTLSQEVSLSRMKIQFGEESNAVRLLENQHIVENYREELRRLGLHESLISKLVEMKSLVLANALELENASISAQNLEAALRAAASAMSQLTSFSAGLDTKIAQAEARVNALRTGANAANASMIAGLKMEAQQRRDNAAALAVGADQLRQINAEYDESISKIDELEDLNKTFEQLTEEQKAAAAASRAGGRAFKDQLKEAEKLRKELESPMVGAIDSVANAFGDFIARGLTDFKGFVQQILGSFQKMISQMIATAVKNRIMLSFGFGGSGVATAAAAGQLPGVGGAALPMMGSFGGGAGIAGIAGGTGLLGGLGNALSMPMFGGGGAGLFAVGANAAAAGGGMMATLGAALPAIGVIAAAFAFFKKKVTELDSGIQGTISNMDILIETFSTIETKRFFGLSKKVTTTVSEMTDEAAEPIIHAVQGFQTSIIEAAEKLDLPLDALNNFSYEFKLSLKGLSEEAKAEKITQELTKMGDAFASLLPFFEDMNDLLQTAQERYSLERKILELEGDVLALRQQELEAVHVLNRQLMARIQLMQAQGDMQSALGAFAAGIAQQQGAIRAAVEALVSPLVEALDRVKAQAQASYQIFRLAADNTRQEAQNIVDIITGAIEARTIRSEAVERLRYQQAQEQLAAFAGGASFTPDQLRRATEGVSIDTTKFFGSFEDYARDFYKTQISLTKLAEEAEGQLTEVEQQIDIAEKAYQVAMGTYQEAKDFNTALDQLLTDLAVYTETAARNEPFIDQIRAEGERQIELLDQILVETSKQVAETLGLSTAVADLVGSNVSVGEALAILGIEGENLAGAVLALNPVVDGIGSHIGELDLTLGGAVDRLGIVADELSVLEGFNFEGPVGDLTTGISYLDETSAGLTLGVVGLDGTVGVLSGNVETQAANILKLDGTIIDQTVSVNALTGEVTKLSGSTDALSGITETLGTNIGDLGMYTDELGIDITNVGNTLFNAMQSLGGFVSSLVGAVQGLAQANNLMAQAQQDMIAYEKEKVIAEQQKDETAETLAALQKQGKAMNVSGEATVKSQFISAGEYSGNVFVVNVDGQKRGQFESMAQANAYIEKLRGLGQVGNSTEAERQALRDQIIALGGVPEFAAGGMHMGGMRLVGEKGPELEVTGPSRIYSAQQTKNLLSGGGSEAAAEIRLLRREVAELRAEQRKIGVENVKFNKKTYDLNREWDIVGLPATRTT